MRQLLGIAEYSKEEAVIHFLEQLRTFLRQIRQSNDDLRGVLQPIRRIYPRHPVVARRLRQGQQPDTTLVFKLRLLQGKGKSRRRLQRSILFRAWQPPEVFGMDNGLNDSLGLIEMMVRHQLE